MDLLLTGEDRIMEMGGMGYQETPLTLIEITLFILMVGDCLCACTRHNLPQYTQMGLTALA